jgi:hypothetical protein
MLEYAGPLHRAVVSRTLWLVLLGPALGLSWQLVVARSRTARARGDAQRQEIDRATVAGLVVIVATTLALVAQIFRLLRLPVDHRSLYDHALSGPPLPGLEAPLDLWLDGRSATVAALVCGLACACAWSLATRPPAERTWPTWAWLHLAMLGALLAFLSDGLAPILVGWALAGASSVWLVGWGNPGASLRSAAWAVVGGAALVVGAVVLFWGLGGSWEDSDYEPEPRLLSAVTVNGGESPALELTGDPGASVFLDDARQSSLRAPFATVVAPGMHTVRVATGESPDLSARFQASPGKDVVLVPVGPTLSIHSMRDALDAVDSRGDAPFRRALEARIAPGGVAVVAAVLLLWLGATFATWTVGTSIEPHVVPAPLRAFACAVTVPLLGAVLLLRVDFLFPSALHTGAVVAIVGAAMVLGATWRALPSDGLARWVAFTTGAPAGLVCIALGLAGSAAALAAMVVLALAVAATHLFAHTLPPSSSPPASDDEPFILAAPARIGSLVVAMEHEVLGAIATAASAATHLFAWTLAVADAHVVAAPGDRVADGLLRATRVAEPALGGRPSRIAWGLLGLLGLAGILHALWPGG